MWIVEDLENAIDIVELVSKYSKLKKAWASYKALCPFPGHNEKTPSFVVSPAKQIAYCFWCHKWWWVLKFVMDMENCDFKEAINILSNFSGIKVNSNFDTKTFETKKSIFSLYKDATTYYKKNLDNYLEIKKYLFDRWINSESIENFHLWYSDSGVNLYNYLKEKWYDEEIIFKSNIFIDLKTKKDKFINRVIFPIQNIRWDFVWFTARIIWEWEPKYINSPASDIYDKSSILYWLFTARNSIVKEWFIIVTEWNADTIALQQHWFFNTVAVSWTALTDKHISIIKRLTHKIYLCFDNDKAWEKATKLTIENLKNKDIEIRIILLSWAKDPDELLKKWIDFQSLIQNAISPVWYYMKKSKWNNDSIDDKKNMLLELLDIVKSYSNNVEQDHFLKEISNLLNINEKVVYSEFNKTKYKTEKKQEINKIQNYSNQELAIWYILKNDENRKLLKENLLFLDTLEKDLKKFIEIWETYLNSLEIEKKERYKASSILIENEEEDKNNITKLIKKINIDSYKTATNNLKEKINSWDKDWLKEYMDIIKLAKENWLK